MKTLINKLKKQDYTQGKDYYYGGTLNAHNGDYHAEIHYIKDGEKWYKVLEEEEKKEVIEFDGDLPVGKTTEYSTKWKVVDTITEEQFEEIMLNFIL